MKIELSNSSLDSINTHAIQHIPHYYSRYFHMPSGAEHYRLLIHLSKCFSNILIGDLGTNRGASAIALSQNLENTVYSLDIVDCKESPIDLPNVEFQIGNFKTDAGIQSKIMSCSLILLDLDHEYTNEAWIYNFLCQNDWKGVMVCDDIHYFQALHRFWDEVRHPKLDISKYGHSSGTGIIIFGGDVELDLI